jgi:prolyl oligopeptidase
MIPVFVLLLGATTFAQSQPVAPIRPVTDTYYGIPVVDPYRYMENLHDPEVLQWMKGQQDFTRHTLDSLPGRAALLADIEKYSNAEPAHVNSVHRTLDGRYFVLKTLAGQSLAKLYIRQSIDAPDVLLVDTDNFKGPHGEPAAINEFSVSLDGHYVACTISQGGAEIGAIHIIDVTTGKEIDQPIPRIWGGGMVWRPDNSSFYYSQLQKLGPNSSPLDLELNSREDLHIIGDVNEDAAVFGAGLSDRVKTVPTDGPWLDVTPGCDYAIGAEDNGTAIDNELYFAPAVATVSAAAPWTPLCTLADQVTDFACHGNDIYLLTHKDADRFKLIHTNLNHPDIANADLVVPEQHGVLRDLHTAADALYLDEMDGGIQNIVRVTFDGKISRLKLPAQGSVSFQSADPRLPGLTFSLATWTKASRIYQYDPATDSVTLTSIQPPGPFDDTADLVSTELRVPSYDGTLVPLSIVMKNGTKLDGNNPTIINAYGGYGLTIDPGFNPIQLAWFQRGGVYAVAHVRGGGECGEAWHQGAFKLTKPNVWRDTIACGKYLIDNSYTNPHKLGAMGGSNGGITIGRAITERPDLFAAAWIRVGVMNALRIEAYPNGIPNVPEYGSVSTQEGFEDLYAMDAYQHVRDGVPYPAVQLTCGMNDPRVTPWMPAKMAARLQAATSSGKPILLRVDYDNGHGIGASKKQYNETTADAYAFLLWQFGDPAFQPK